MDDPQARLEARIDNDFAYHKADEATGRRHSQVRLICRALAKEMAAAIPPGREQSLAITKLEEAMFWANAGIARQSEVDNDGDI